MTCMGLDPAKTNLLYFAGEFVPGVISSVDDPNNNDNTDTDSSTDTDD